MINCPDWEQALAHSGPCRTRSGTNHGEVRSLACLLLLIATTAEAEPVPSGALPVTDGDTMSARCRTVRDLKQILMSCRSKRAHRNMPATRGLCLVGITLYGRSRGVSIFLVRLPKLKSLRLLRRFRSSRVGSARAGKAPLEVKVSDNHQSAVDAATRRAHALGCSCSIYAERGVSGNRRVLMAEAAAPDGDNKWYRIATIRPDGSYSFEAELFDDALIVVPPISSWGPGD